MIQVEILYERRKLIFNMFITQLQVGRNQPRDTLMQQELL